jgi:threonine/homoserine efflux transporter RhtA
MSGLLTQMRMPRMKARNKERRQENVALRETSRLTGLVAPAVYTMGTVVNRISVAINQPLVARGIIAPAVWTTTFYAMYTLIWTAAMPLGFKKMDKCTLREVNVPGKLRRKLFRGLSRYMRCPEELARLEELVDPEHHGQRPDNAQDTNGTGSPGHGPSMRIRRTCERLIVRIIAWERGNQWALTIAPALVSDVVLSFLSPIALARLPIVEVSGIAGLGGCVLALRGAWKEDDRKPLRVFLPLAAMAGVAMMIPWGHHVDVIGMSAALGGAACAYMSVGGVKKMVEAKISIKGDAIISSASVLCGLPWLLSTTSWMNLVVITHIAISALITVIGYAAILWAVGRMPNRAIGVLAANKIGWNALVGRVLLHQPVGPYKAGILTIWLSAFITAFTGGGKVKTARNSSTAAQR